MRNLLLLLVIVLSILSCQGNKTKQDTLKNAVETFKDSLGTLEVETFIPERYSEVKTDTILSNGFKISIKTYTDMNRFVTINYNVDEHLKHIDKYRDWISEVKITKDNVLVFDKTIDATFFQTYDTSVTDSLPKAINNKVWLDEDQTFQKNAIYLIGGFIFPESETLKYYRIKIDFKGKYNIETIK